jgi:hypothetical protein
LIAHTTRELSRGVVAGLEDENVVSESEPVKAITSLSDDVELRVAETLSEPRDATVVREVAAAILAVLRDRGTHPAQDADVAEETFRIRIGSALGLPSDADLVRQWFGWHQTMVRAAHWRLSSPDVGPLRPAFAGLAELLYGRVGPIFDTEAELDQLAAIAVPTAADLARVRRLLPRPVQRRYFFDRLQNPAWVEPLAAAGMFRRPPERQVFADQSWSMRPWPEGQYLLRMVSAQPARVAEIFNAIPDSVENPAVWAILSDTVLELPAEQAAVLVPKLMSALRTAPSVFFPHRALKAATRLASVGRHEAFDLAAALIWFRSVPEVPAIGETELATDYVERLQKHRNQFIYRDAWILLRIDDHDFGELVATLVPALATVDASRTLAFTAEKLLHAIRLVNTTRRGLAEGIAAAVGAASTEGSTDTSSPSSDGDDGSLDLEGAMAKPEDEPGDTRRWCDRLDQNGQDEGVRAVLASTVLIVAQKMVQDGAPAAEIVASLDRYPNEIFHRLQFRLMADQPTLASPLRARFEALIESEESLSPPYGAREIAHLLRTHFSAAAPAAQQAFLARLEAGPGDESITARIAFWERTDTPEERTEIIEQWQRTRVRWFHDQIPSLLAPLATRLGVAPAILDNRQQSLDETGSWSSGVSSAGERSPITVEALIALEPEALVQYLATWRPAQAGGNPFETPSIEGLGGTISAMATEHPGIAVSLLRALERRPLPLSYTSAILRGLHSAIRQKKDVSIVAVLGFARYAWQLGEREVLGGGTDAGDIREAVWIGMAACDVIDAALEREAAVMSDLESLWDFATHVVASPLTPRTADPSSMPETFGAARNLAVSMLGGRAVEMVMAIAWRDFMLNNPKAVWPSPAASGTATHLIPLLDRLLAHSGLVAIAVEGSIGRAIPQLFWIARDWTASNLSRVFDRGATNPATRPALGMYLTNTHLVTPTFSVVRPWYAGVAATLPANGAVSPQDLEGALAHALAEHVITAAIRGLCVPGDADQLLQNTFNRVPLAARTHAYWLVYRWWSDSAADDVATLSIHVIAFWEWRLGELEVLAPSEQRDEEADGLGLLIAAPHLPAADVIRLGQRTVALLRTKHRTGSLAWERLGELAQIDPSGTFEIVSKLVELALAGSYAYLPFDEVAPSLRSAIGAGGPLRYRALALIDRLGVADLGEYRQLWVESQG